MIAVIVRKEYKISWEQNKMNEKNLIHLERLFLGEDAIKKAESYMKEKNLDPSKYELVTGDFSHLEPFEVKVIVDDKENEESTEFKASVERGLQDVAEGRTYTEEEVFNLLGWKEIFVRGL